MTTIKAPFNFVPLSTQVYFPDWADQISQDIPFSDGMSGIIDLKITAESPIFVRNGHTKKDAEGKTEAYKSFSKTSDGRYFIPATSIKGAIRNVLEIMSLGKMNIVQNESFSIRDLSNGTDGLFYKNKIKPENIHCGWLKLNNDRYLLNDCGLPWRISEEELDNKYGCGLENFVKNGDFKKDENRTAKAKYKLFGTNSLHNSFSPDDDLRESQNVDNRLFVKFDDEGESGTIVFTGQPGQRKKKNKPNKKGTYSWENKYYEFVIPDNIEKDNIEVDDYTIDEFLSIHKNSPDFNDFRKKLLDGDPIPVFFMYDKNDDTVVDSIGLSYMYKYPAFNSIYNAIPADFLFKDSHDLADCIFGYSLDKKKLKGRVQFTNAFATEHIQECTETNFALSSPNPSYYPLYLGNGQTWNSEKVKIAGRKRYPVRTNILSNKATDAMTSYAIPLDKGVVFKGRIFFHNLREVELGALLSALTFHDTSECFHNIGQGKPLGYGKIKVETTLSNSKLSKQELLDIFTTEMNDFVRGEWKRLPSITELLAMARGITAEQEGKFTYMKMNTNRAENEFLTGKEEYAKGYQLGSFSEIINGNVPRCAFVGNVKESQQRINEEKIQEEKRKKEREFDLMLEEAKALLEHNDLKGAQTKIAELEAYAFGIGSDKIQAIKDRINFTLNERKQQFTELKSQADALFSNKEYEKALETYNRASQYEDSLKYIIKECEEKIAKRSSIANSSIEEFLSAIKLASIEAFAGNLKKRNELQQIVQEDIPFIVKFLKVQIPLLKKDKQKAWMSQSKWASIAKVIGQEKADSIFNKINK